MLYFLYLLKEQFVIFNVFKYITFRSFGAGVTAFLISVILGGKFIQYLKNRQYKESIREDGPPNHSVKAGTPTMGGVFIVAAIIISSLLWVNLLTWKIWFVLLFTISFAALGFMDDWLKLTSGKGLSARSKFMFQIIIGIFFITILVISQSKGFSMTIRVGEIQNYSFSTIILPFLKEAVINLGYLYIPFALLVVVGASNAVNLTDGLDGLAIGSIAIASGTYIIFAYLTGNSEFARYLQIPYIPEAGELAVFLASVGGACLGFLWYNSHPAQVFMGDVGSLSLGAAIGSSALIIKQEILLVIVGGIFFIEALSVILQVISFKFTGKRIFKMAPLHHHFELSGWSESKVVIRFWIICVVLSLIALSSLKLR
ncbi:MAG: phospho-N-acetylmuramoyl-pentapeptide-transferase [Candidatus Dadabacteria bacterium]|nr:phospho-N-acetylmuramoyl-pentapeptide-transferase [Candidatus Dadabacteria bacterium]NIQ15330.1 phospho-N-acetylmuramoyl-pentapeptide-transferase [Candidatus Dadabacteria bacterium]